ncbi:O-succinylhomoserine sulfhydrylase [Amorphus coralli]|uniref:O-succinylhomoserine sulfhydrylase n=1 Tax=Amorphus coralli TaxID=340680 RepID=UPI000371C68A|nr:O-succinylhomoserine sulfhydrylase [Amorphus coralli]
MSSSSLPSDVGPSTRLVHGGVERSQFGETCEALYLTQGFVYESAEAAEARFAGEEDGYVYSRYGNPTVTMFQDRMALLEGAEAARATASGMAAVTAAMVACTKAGDHVVASKALFGGCRYVVEEFLPRFGVEATLVDGPDVEAWKQAVRPNTTALFTETPANPTLALVDIPAVAEIAHSVGARLVVDNVFATAMHQAPLKLGADVVVYSATKHVDGQGRCLGGVILSDEEWVTEKLDVILRQTGPAMSPFNAWIMLKSLETYPLRIRQQTASATAVADAIADHPRVARVIYPGRADHPQADIARKQMTGGGTLIALEIAGGRDPAFAFSNALNVVKISNNLGDAKSLITHPASTTHQRLTDEQREELGIGPGLLRLSIGLEDEADLIADMTQALDRAGKKASVSLG